MESYTTQVQKTDDKGNPVTTNIQLVLSMPKLDDKGKPVLTNGVAVTMDTPIDAKGGDQTSRSWWTKVDTQPIPVGPVARFESIKQLFTNGGGWYGVNSAHPFENPTPLSDFLEMLAIIVVPMAQVYMFGLLIGNKKHAWCLFCVMLAMYVFSFGVAWYAKHGPIPLSPICLRTWREGTALWRDEQRAVGRPPAPRSTTAR